MLLNLAHVKWFVDSQNILNTNPPTWPWTAAEIILAASVSVAVILLVIFAESRYIPQVSKDYLKTVKLVSPSINRLFAGLIGLFLLSIGVFWDVILTPEVSGSTNTFHEILRVAEVAAGLLFISGWKRGILFATYATVLLYVLVGFIAGPVFWLENIVFVGAALYLLVNFTESKAFRKTWQDYSVPVLRITTGITLIAFAFSEKLIHPTLSDVFLDEHGWNFMQKIGLDFFTNNYFILMAGFVETIFGILLILGVATRATTLALCGLFATSVVTMLIQKGNWEVEDLPVYAVAMVLIAFGSGKHFLLKKKLI
jgi:uncharacterized membrane protein YphA (DoxX/SURF4 family)